MKTLVLAVAGVALLSSGSFAQSNQFGGLVVGNTGPSTIIASLAGRLYTQDIATCATAVSRGSTLTMARNAGGTAYDAARQAVWVSDGRMVVLKDIGTGTETCKFTPTLTGGKNNLVTGLAHSNRRRVLIQLETFPTPAGSSGALRFYDTTQCPPTLLTTTCSFVIPRGNTAGTAQGLAYDEVRDLVFYSTSVPGIVTSSSLNYVPFAVACLLKPSVIPVPLFSTCGGTNVLPVTGLGYDSCGQIMYVTNGDVMLQLGLKDLTRPVNLNANKPCCKFAVPRLVWAGLAYIPKSTDKPVGSSCLGANCPGCPSMGFDIRGDLVLGNQQLSLEISGAPAGGTASLYISIGQCVTPGVTIPGLCGAIHPAIGAGQPLLLGGFPLSAGTGCSGGLKLTTAVPNDLALCNLFFCAQFLIQCPGGNGAGMTNAVEFKVGG